ncbi:hypothetical protein K438DRAFT_1929963 [Mycena galopus ATCC 62051]|nr:hypothetical protein K438DRAFT_1929963 [Mycena galopus ATCC 62051]
MAEAFHAYVTLDRRACHPNCGLVQLNRFILNGHSTHPGDYFQGHQGGEAGRNGVCGKAKKWGYCTQSIEKHSPVAPRDFPQAANDVDWNKIVENAVNRAIAIAGNQAFVDGNHRTALLAMFEHILSAGLHITSNVDIFRLYVQMKSLTDDVGSFKKTDEAHVRQSMIKLMKDVVRIHPSPAVPTAPVTFNDRLRLALTAKNDVSKQLAAAVDYKRRLDAAIAQKHTELERREVIRSWNSKTKKENPKLFGHFQFIYPGFAL